MIILFLNMKSDYFKILQIEQNLFKNTMIKKELNNFFSQSSFRIWKIEEDKITGYISFYQVMDEVEIIKIGIIKLKMVSKLTH